MWTDGSQWLSVTSDWPGGAVYRTMPTPPATRTARLLSTRALVPRLQSTILPATAAGSSSPTKHSSDPALAESMISNEPSVASVTDAPSYEAALPRVTVASKVRSWVLAPTVVSQRAPA